EGQQVAVDGAPVVPGDGVVLAVGVVVALLGTAELIATEQQGHAEGGQHRGEQGPLLTAAQGEDAGVGGRSFGSAVPRAIVVGAIPVVFTVGLVVLVVV